MKINQIIVENTTAGSIATVEQPLGSVQKRSGSKKAGSMFKGKTTNKPFYEDQVTEDDKIIAPGKGNKFKPGLLNKPENSMNPTDTVKLDVPLLIRLLEYAREDANSDMDLHDLAEKLVARGSRGKTLSMKDYSYVVDEGIGGGLAGGVIGAALTKSPGGAMTGAKLGSQVQDMMTKEGEDQTPGVRTKYRATVEYGPTAADAKFVTVIAGSTEEAEAKVQPWCKKNGVRNPMITINGADLPMKENAAWETPEEKAEIAKYRDLFKAAAIAGDKVEMEKLRKIIYDLSEKARVAAGTRGYQHGGPPPGWKLDEEGVAEGAKVDRMVKHVAQSEKKLGHSKKEAENIAWATANKRGMLNNKNKK